MCAQSNSSSQLSSVFDSINRRPDNYRALAFSSSLFFRFVALFFIPSSLVYWTHTNSNACGNLVIDFQLVYFTFCGAQCLNLSVDQFGGQEQRKRTVDY